ncbi:MAG: adenylate/guanylate cyclase domain-containing protein [Kofleriaceae bacterium]
MAGDVDRWFARMIRVGRDASLNASDARYIVLTNIVALLGVGFSLAFAPILVISGHALYPLLQIAYAAVYVPTLFFNRSGHHTLATTWLIVASHVAVITQVLVEGVGLDVHLFFMLHAVLPFLLYAPRHDRLMWATSILAGADLVIVMAFRRYMPTFGPVIDPSRIMIIRPILLGGLFTTVAACAWYARRATLLAEAAFDRAHQRSEELLLNILPSKIANRLKSHDGTIAEDYKAVTVLFADIVGFTTMSARMEPEKIVALLNDLFCRFDDLADQLKLEKIKTIGDCYMVAGGIPEPRADHAEAVADMALGMMRIVHEQATKVGEPLDVRIGIHSGPVVAGVIGKRKFVYDLWGDTVNTASRMESHGVPGTIQLTSTTQRLLPKSYLTKQRGTITVKGKGEMDTWILDAKTSSS